ncbi:hypothetical protein [Serratia sp. 3ACOL1]|uniref:phage tail fiber protein n=1 Tax=Serratia sp. 3ACOL1 TaxID=2448483 RepID=UPI001EE4877B|nr:hypothetical protein [Serratia sp. 3ACOL1]
MWYKTGTINLIANNAAVTGTGTAWADAKFGVMPGMILLAPDNKLYEVKQVNSNTSLTLNSNYAGSTASGQNYAIITTYEGDISQFSARFAAMLTFFQGSRNDTVSWFTGSGDMTFTKDDGTKLTVPTLAKIQSDYVSRTSTLDQSIASTVLFAKPIRLSNASGSAGFIPASQGAWVSWNRKTSTDDGLTGATDFITHKGGYQGGWNFWSTDGSAINLVGKLSWSGYLSVIGGLVSVGDQSMQAGVTTPNLLLRFKDVSGVEKGAVYAQTDTGAMNIRWGGTAYTMACRTDGLITVPKGHVISTAISTPQELTDIVGNNSAPLAFRGADTASFNVPNNYSIGTWYGFSVVPTIGTSLGEGVEQGKPVFYVNARQGTAYVLKNMYIGSLPVVKTGDFGLGVTNSAEVFDFTQSSSPAGIHRAIEGQNGAPAGGSAMVGMTASISGSYSGHIYTSHGATPGAIKLQAGWTRSNGTLDFVSAWHSGNTTVDSNGFIKKASPIARLSSNPEKMSDEYLDGFTLSGLAAVNGEAAGVTAERVSVGVYKVTGSLGFALEGWNIEVPQDVNGNRLCFVATEAAEDGTITVKVSKRRFDIDTAAIVAGEAMDIPEGRWIDLRLEMPPVEEVQSEPEPESHEGEMASE